MKIENMAQFEQEFAYDGPLGVDYSLEQSIFRLWAPTAVEVALIVIDDMNREVCHKMERQERGVWTTVLEGDCHLVCYAYRLTFEDGSVRNSMDPYARACVANGMKSVVINPKKAEPQQWGKRMPAFTNPTDAIIYELHIRDFSIYEGSGVSPQWKGKFLGVVEEGTMSSSGMPSSIDYLTQLGVTHVQFLPMYDYASVDELSLEPQYNWGYDPLNYNVPEGSYSTNPSDPLCRIIEMKRMIQALHNKGLRVIMDVVYNHVYEVAQHAFDNTVPGYFYRYEKDKTFANGTGCGNDTASERVMMRKYMVDSIVYWATHYQIDGFRFDLMGNHDIETMNAIRQALDKIDPSIIVLGEGWNLNTPLDTSQKAIQANAYRMPRIAHFSDNMRDSVKGSVFLEKEGAFVNGVTGYEQAVLDSLLGGEKISPEYAHFIAPHQVIQYVEAHDNLTLYDKLLHTNPEDDVTIRAKRHLLATSIILLAYGIPFLHAGQEFMRTKFGDENSYRSSDVINQFDWDYISKNKSMIEHVKALIRLRKAHEVFRLDSYELIESCQQVIQADDLVIAYTLTYENRCYLLAFNANESSVPLSVEKSDAYHILWCSDDTSENVIDTSSVTLPALSSIVLCRPL